MTKYKRILLECTGTWESDGKTGIQRVVRNIIKESLSLRKDFDVELVPIILKFNRFWRIDEKSATNSFGASFLSSPKGIYRKIRPLLMKLSPSEKAEKIFLPQNNRVIKILSKLFDFITYPIFLLTNFRKEIIPHKDDIILLLDSSWSYPIWTAIKKAKNNNAVIGLVIYDLFPIIHPNFFPPVIPPRFTAWLEDAVKNVNFIIGISKTVQTEIQKYLHQNYPQYLSKIRLDSFFLGCELDNVTENITIRNNLKVLFEHHNVYITVGTIEPRKNHEYLLDTFDLIWRQGFDIHLCIIGKLGWSYDKVWNRILKHPRFRKNLFIYNDINDTELNYCYKHSKAMIFPSYAEGYGLPIVEALANGLPVIASNIPIHREVGKDFCTYFDINKPSCLAEIIIDIEKTGKMPPTRNLSAYDLPKWKDSCKELLTKILYLSKTTEEQQYYEKIRID